MRALKILIATLGALLVSALLLAFTLGIIDAVLTHLPKAWVLGAFVAGFVMWLIVKLYKSID